MSKHTPGPWGIRDGVCQSIHSPHVGHGYYGSLATVTQRDPNPVHGGGISNETAIANAKLIAAAPDLLSALIEIQNIALAPIPINKSRSEGAQQKVNDIRLIARDALTKATGEDS